MRRLVDLHAHTNVSDGTLSPAQLVEAAAHAGLAALAVTDHDQVGALPEARAAGKRLGVEIVSGIELSVEHEGRDVHLLGYLLDESDPTLLARLAELRDVRERRAERMLEKLRALGHDITIPPQPPGTSLGRPHMARALVDAGIVASVQEAFDELLAEGRPAFVPKAKLAGDDAIALVHGAGGVAVLAHPGILPEHARDGIVRAFAAWGLDGVEVMHPKNAEPLRRHLLGLAGELGLAESGGSDYHGENKPDVRLGMEPVPYESLVKLRARALEAPWARRARG